MSSSHASLPADSVSLAPRARALAPSRPYAAAASIATAPVALLALAVYMGARPLARYAHLVWTPAVARAWLGAVEYFTAFFVAVDVTRGLAGLAGAVTINGEPCVAHLALAVPEDALTVRAAHLRAFLSDERTCAVVALAGLVVQRQALARILEAAAALGAPGERVRVYVSPGSITPSAADGWSTLVIRGPRFVGLATVLGAGEGDRHEELTVYEAEAAPARLPEPAPAEPDVPIDRAPPRDELPPLARSTPRMHTPAHRMAGVR